MKKLYLLFFFGALCFTAIAQPSNNEACGAIPLTVDPVANNPYGTACTPGTTISWVGATASAGYPNSTCSWAGQQLDVWYSFTVPPSGSYIINLEPVTGVPVNNIYTGFQYIIQAGNCNTTMPPVGGCSTPGMSYPTTEYRNQTPGAVQYLRIWVNGGGSANGQVKICISEIPALPASTQKVGIGIATPRNSLDVNGTLHVQQSATILGNVGIGNTDPAFALDVSGRMRLRRTTQDGSAGIWLNGSNNVPAGFMGLQNDTIVGFYGNNWHLNVNTQTGNVGIGSANPRSPLSFASSLGNKITFFGNGNSNQYGLGLQSGLLQIYSDAPAANIGFGYGSSTTFTERARIINQGEFGMQLTGRLQLRTGSNSAGLWLTNSANTANVSFIGLASDNQVGFFSPSGPGWGITMNTTNGYVGLGLNGAQPLAPLQFSNSLGLTKISLYRGTYGDVGIGVYGGELRLQNDIPGGKVSLGALQTDGSFSELAKAERNGGFAFSINGSLWVNGTTYSSDKRFKENITTIQSPLEKILQLNGVSYNMSANDFKQFHFGKGKEMGLLAQDVQKIIPEVVSEKDGYLGVDYAKLVPLLIEAIKEQNKKIERLEAILNLNKVQ